MEQLKTVCRNPWCKATFFYKESDMIPSDNINESGEVIKVAPSECPKCKSFNEELSAGVAWSEKKYEGSRNDGVAHPMAYKVTRSIDRKW